MDFVCLHDKQEIEQFLREDVYLHMYSLGDLDDFFWPYTIWYGLRENGRLSAIALLYVGVDLPTLLALSNEPDQMATLLSSIDHLLPQQFYAHFSPGLESILASTHQLEPHGDHYKMGLVNDALLNNQAEGEAKRLSMSDLPAIQTLYRESYPGNWFDSRMLETNQYFGIVVDNRLVSIAGIHVYSPEYQVAALGNITTHPDFRNRGYGTQVTAALSRSLRQEGLQVGLNVKADNIGAITSYRKIGFEVVAAYGEFFVQRKNRLRGTD